MTIKTDQHTGVQTILNEQGKTVMSDDILRDEKIEEVINDNTGLKELVQELHELNCSDIFIGRMLLQKFGKEYVAEYLAETIIYPEENTELDSALQCIQANFNLMEFQIKLQRKCGKNTEADILQGMLDILIISSQDMITLKAKRDSKKGN